MPLFYLIKYPGMLSYFALHNNPKSPIPQKLYQRYAPVHKLGELCTCQHAL